MVPRRSARVRVMAAFAAALLAGACIPLGPDAIRAGRTQYNIALRSTEDEQLLLNLVRLRYRDTAYFLRTTTLTTTFSFNPEAEASATLGPNIDGIYGVRGGFAYEERPTVAYTPLQGQEFVSQVMQPISLRILLTLTNSGWSVERVLRLCVEEINGVPNAPRASGPTPDEPPQYRDFARAADLLRELQLERAVSIAYVRTDDDSRAEDPEEDEPRGTPMLRFTSGALESDAYAELTGILGLTSGRETFDLRSGLGEGGDSLHMETRSFAGILFYLSQSVKVPAADEEAGRVTVTTDAHGNVFDWSQVTERLMHVHSNRTRPANAAIAVRYRGSWFYIDDSDLDSKSTFMLLSLLSALMSGDPTGVQPLTFTVPVG